MDLAMLQPVYGHPGPYLSIYINVSRDAEDATKAIQVRWRDAREELADQGAGEPTLQALDDAVGRDDDEGGPRGQILFATGGDVVFDALVTDPPQNYAVRLAPLPDPMPLLGRRAPNVPYVLAVCDSVGADLTSVDVGGRRRHSRVDGDDHPVHKPRGGAEHHKQMQRAVDEQLKTNQAKVAKEVRHLASAGAAELIVVAGDPGVRQTLVDELGEGARAEVVQAEAGSRASGSAEAPLEEEITAHLRDHATRQQQAAVDEYEHERGTGGRATEGLGPIVEALRRGVVQTLLWNRDSMGAAQEQAFVGSRPEQLGFTEQEVRDLGVTEPQRDDLAAALVRAAAGTGAGLQFVTDDAVTLQQGVGALLRGTEPGLPA